MILGPLLALLVLAIGSAAGLTSSESITAAVTVLCIAWWISEAIPIPVTALLPLALLPLADIITGKQSAEALGSPVIQLMLGGFILSRALEETGAHRQIAIAMVHLFGGRSGRRLVVGFLVTSAALSMWISNTATVLMLLPVALAILERADDPRLAPPVLLALAYGASVGGIGTPIGTPPNLIFMEIYRETGGPTLSFLDWMAWALPVVLLFIPLIALWLGRGLADAGGAQLPPPAPWTSAQKRAVTVFAITALAWMTRTAPFGGWSGWLSLPGSSDAVVALLAVIALFTIPDKEGQQLLGWQQAVRIPWGILLLFAGGIALAVGFNESGLAERIGRLLAGLGGLPTPLLVLVICLGVTFMTETTSNTAASATLLMPLLAATAVGIGLNPAQLMVPAAMSASCAFMLPVATPPNSIVFGSGQLTIQRMAREGLVLNITGAMIITGVILALVH